MNYILKNGMMFDGNKFDRCDILVVNGLVEAVSSSLFSSLNTQVIDCENKYIFPGFADVHVHLREPGFIYKETIKSGTMAAAHGGYTSVCSMPNLSPTPDTVENVLVQKEIIDKDALIEVIPYATITIGQKGEELSDFDGVTEYVCAFSDDGRGVQSTELMLMAMQKAKSINKMIVAHCEDNSLLNGGYIHEGEYASLHGHKGICSKSEWKQIERDIELVERTGVAYHVCHISAKESVDLIRKAKSRGVNITCETAPHYLVLSDMNLQENGRFKMNPPIRSEEDRLALIEGIKDGTIDMIATDHAPHSAEEKSKGLKDSNMGVVGLETAFPILYTHLVKKNVISLEKLIELMSINPKRRFGIKGGIIVGDRADLTVYDLNETYNINPEDFLSKGKSTPFENMTVNGKCVMTMFGGKIVWQEK